MTYSAFTDNAHQHHLHFNIKDFMRTEPLERDFKYIFSQILELNRASWGGPKNIKFLISFLSLVFLFYRLNINGICYI